MGAPTLPPRFARVAPPLLELRADELPFAAPAGPGDRAALDLAVPTTRPTVRDALLRACGAPLTPQQREVLCNVMHAPARQCPASALAAAAPRAASMAEHNPAFAPHYLLRVATTQNDTLRAAVRDALCRAPVSLPLLEAVAQCYAPGSPMPPDLLLAFSRACIARCTAAADALEKKKRRAPAEVTAASTAAALVAKYFASLLASPTARDIIARDPSLASEIQAFCLRFGSLQECTALYKTICALSSPSS